MNWYKYKVRDVLNHLYYGYVQAKNKGAALRRVDKFNTNTSEVEAVVPMKRGPADGREVVPPKRSSYKW